MSAVYVTKDRDVLDMICINHYGYCRGAMEAVLQANPWLAHYTGPLPKELTIILPQIEEQPKVPIVRIWSNPK